MAAALWSISATAADLAGSAVVKDGDSLELASQEVRLLGADAFEVRQQCRSSGRWWPCGQMATVALWRLIDGRDVRCQGSEHDRYGRLLVVCHAGNRDLGRALVSFGLALAWVPEGGVPGPDYSREEAIARATRTGTWSGAFVEPWQWRRGERLPDE